MGIVKAVKSGNWSDATVWSPAAPTSADDVYSNTFTVTIDTSPTVLSIQNGATTGVTAGGGFVISSSGITFIGSVNVSGVNSVSNLLTVSHATGSVTIQGNVVGPPFNSSRCMQFTSNGTLNIVGNVTGGASQTGIGVLFSGTGILNVTGSCNATESTAIQVSSTGTLNVTGSCSSTNTGTAIINSSTGTANITGTCTGGSSTGNAFVNSSTGTITHIGTAQASATAPAIGAGAVGQVTILTGPLLSTDASYAGAASSGVNPCVALRWFPADTALGTFEYRVRGQTVAGSPSARPARQLFLTDAYSGTYPTAANVRNGTAYGPGNIYTGTCAVPAAASVLSGVPVGATTGTATISAADIRAAVGLATANLDTQLSAKPSATAIRTEMDTNSTKLANLDATVSSRLAGASYQAPLDAAGTRSAVGLATGNLDTQLSGISSGVSGLPSAATIATAVWAAATRTLTTAIDNSSTIAAAVWSYATGRTITGGTVDTLTNAPSVPSAATIASQVRTELSTELGRIDATVSSRLAPAGTLARVTLVDTTTTLTNAPDVPTEAEIADAVRTELAPELARVSNAATTQEVADIVEGAS